jgi:prepilin-type N-terminal cleavage/methylation domain-containing protein
LPIKNSKGFSLLEVLVVLGIIVLMMTLITPTVSSYFQVSINSAARDLASRIKEAYNSAVITGRVYRLVYDLKENTYWVESGPPQVLLNTKASVDKEERRSKFRSTLTSQSQPPQQFSMDKAITRKKVSLPRGVTYGGVLGTLSAESQTAGTAYSHFFPSGISEQTVIYLKDSSQHEASLVISSLLGTTDLYNRHIEGAEAFGK